MAVKAVNPVRGYPRTLEGEMQNRIENLEISCGYLQKTIDELSGVVIEQQKEIRELQRMLKILAEKFQELSSPVETAPDEKPPHY